MDKAVLELVLVSARRCTAIVACNDSVPHMTKGQNHSGEHQA
jgi:hypothetical protein